MLALTRRKDTAVLLGQDVLVTFRGFRGGKALIEVTLPSGCSLRGPDGPIETHPGVEASVSRGLVSLKKEDSIQIGDDLKVMIIGVLTDGETPCKVRLGIDAPPHVAILRYELSEAGKKETPPATDTPSESGSNP
ncbi:MAG: carbon storage regulator [Planctomycetota bacterium]|nr:carbon storage regulator [Planctomycetota bacterium]